jgi:arylsulfatase
MDQNIGRVIECLRGQGKLDNTMLLFLSDNGGAAEGGELGGGDPALINSPELSSEIQGMRISYGRAWAGASNTPFRMHKKFVHEGGMSTPLIVHWPERLKPGGTIREAASLIDLMPTLLEISGAEYPAEHNGEPIFPLEGKSLMPLMEDGVWEAHEYMFWEHENNCAVRRGRYKALQKFDTGKWELYDVEADRAEMDEIGENYPDILAEIIAKWYEWAKTHHVVPKK